MRRVRTVWTGGLWGSYNSGDRLVGGKSRLGCNMGQGNKERRGVYFWGGSTKREKL